MTKGADSAVPYRGIHTVRAPEELDLATADHLYEQGRAAIARNARLVLLDLAGMSFCDARGLSAFVRIANDADAAGCRYALIAPQAPVVRILRITGLDKRLKTFASARQALRYVKAITGDRSNARSGHRASRRAEARSGRMALHSDPCGFANHCS